MYTSYELSEKITTLLEATNYKELKPLLCEENPVDVAEAFDLLPEKDVSICFRLLPKEQAAEVFVEMDSDKQEKLIGSFNDARLREIISELYLDDAADLVEEMPAGVVTRILKNTDAETRNAINEILLYPKNSVGSMMTMEYVSLKKTMTVAEAFAKIRRVGVDIMFYDG